MVPRLSGVRRRFPGVHLNRQNMTRQDLAQTSIRGWSTYGEWQTLQMPKRKMVFKPVSPLYRNTGFSTRECSATGDSSSFRMTCVMRSAGLRVMFISSSINRADSLISSTVTWHYTVANGISSTQRLTQSFAKCPISPVP